jgi:sugar/nucleoside kinase (ribokinase family)
MKDGKPILCLGIIVADLIGGPLPALPERGRLVLVENMGLYPGGGAVNTATALSKLGFNVSLIGKVGPDTLGDYLIETLDRRGINIQGVGRSPTHGTSATMAMVDSDGERRFVHYIGANAALLAEDVTTEVINEASILHLAGSFVLPGLDGLPTAEMLKKARESSTITFLDTAWDASDRWLDLIDPCLPHLDYMVPNLSEARAITGRSDPADIAQTLIDRGVGTVAIKMGRNGCLVKNTSGDMFRLPAYEVQVEDTTGAGDAFAAGFIAGVYMNWSLDMTARLANAVGALCVTGMGALGGVTSLEETVEFMSTQTLEKA